jgi:hypothetical protein
MKIEKNNVLRASFIIGCILIILGALFRISHWKGGNVLYAVGFVAVTISLILTNTRKSKQD